MSHSGEGTRPSGQVGDRCLPPGPLLPSNAFSSRLCGVSYSSPMFVLVVAVDPLIGGLPHVLPSGRWSCFLLPIPLSTTTPTVYPPAPVPFFCFCLCDGYTSLCPAAAHLIRSLLLTDLCLHTWLPRCGSTETEPDLTHSSPHLHLLSRSHVVPFSVNPFVCLCWCS